MAPQITQEPGLMEVPTSSVYIDGAFVAPRGEETLEVVNPATEDVIGTIVDAGPALADQAMAAARRALPGWSSTPVETRAAMLDALADRLEARGEQLAALVSSEIGMPIRDARAGQVDLPSRVLHSLADIARSYPWDERDASGSSIVREPAGVVLGITPWNFPVHQIIAKLAPALAAGCTMVLKPAELTPLNALFVASLCDEIGLPPGVFNVVTGTGAHTGEALLQTRAYDVVSFTGSLAVGRHVGAIAGESIVRATLELGGKSPAVVLEDADLELAVSTTVRNCFVNAGQKCNAPTRLLVPAGRRAEAAEIAADTARAYRLGDPLDETTTMGPLVSAAQRQKVLGFVDAAAGYGARVVTGGTIDGWDRGFYFSPAIITEVERDAPIVRDEVFGPVLTVLGFDDVDDAVAMANDSEYGLSAEVWSGDEARAAGLARRIRAGQVRVNGVRTAALPVSPFGGYKKSGLGRELGSFGLDEFVEIKAILGDPDLS